MRSNLATVGFPILWPKIGMEDSESGPVYYQKTSDSTYIVWFPTILGESATYESSTKKRY